MNKQIKEQYDSLYAQTSLPFGGGESVTYLPLFTNLLAQGNVLDVGGGDGQNTLRLAEQGFQVTAVDLSDVGLKKLNDRAIEKGFTINTISGDITTLSVPSVFDGVIMTFVLHHLKTTDALAVIKKLQAQTTILGVHFIATFMNEGGLYERAKKSNRFYPDVDTIQSLYEGWQIHVADTKAVTTLAKDKQGQPFSNQTLFFIAQKLR